MMERMSERKFSFIKEIDSLVNSSESSLALASIIDSLTFISGERIST